MKKSFMIGIIVLCGSITLSACGTVEAPQNKQTTETLLTIRPDSQVPVNINGSPDTDLEHASRTRMDDRIQQLIADDNPDIEYISDEKKHYDENGVLMLTSKRRIVQVKSGYSNDVMQEINRKCDNSYYFESDCNDLIKMAEATYAACTPEEKERWEGYYYESSYGVIDADQRLLQLYHKVDTYTGGDKVYTIFEMERYEGFFGQDIYKYGLWRDEYDDMDCTVVIDALADQVEKGNITTELLNGYKETLCTFPTVYDYYYSKEGLVVICMPGYLTPEDEGFLTYVIPYEAILPYVQLRYIPEKFLTDIEVTYEQIPMEQITRLKFSDTIQEFMAQKDERFTYKDAEREVCSDDGKVVFHAKITYPCVASGCSNELLIKLNQQMQDIVLEYFSLDCNYLREESIHDYESITQIEREHWAGAYMERNIGVISVGENFLYLYEKDDKYRNASSFITSEIRILRIPLDGQPTQVKEMAKEEYRERDVESQKKTYLDKLEEALLRTIEREEDTSLLLTDYQDQILHTDFDTKSYYSKEGMVVILYPDRIKPREEGYLTYTIPYEDLSFMEEKYFER